MAKDGADMKKKANRTRNCQVKFYTTEIEKKQLETEARAAGMDLGTYLRECGLKKTVVKFNTEDFTNMSKNLNSIARRIDLIAKEEKKSEEDRRYEDLKELVVEMQGIIFKTISDIYKKYL